MALLVSDAYRRGECDVPAESALRRLLGNSY